MSEVSISRFSPSMDGVEVCSSWDCVRTEKTWLTLNGETKWVPAERVSPVTRPKYTRTPTFPAGTYAKDAQPRMMNSSSPIPTRIGPTTGFGFEVIILGSKCDIKKSPFLCCG